MAQFAVGGELANVQLSLLDLDWRNPRLSDQIRTADSSQQELALYIDKHHDALRVARSIDQHGFFISEPLIAVALGKRYVVVEGNRRLVALKGLSGARLRSALQSQTPGWSRLGSLPSQLEIPVVIVAERDQVDALLGFRHISGIEPWDPFAQARYIYELVEKSNDFSSVARIVGREETEVRSMYRDHDILEQAKTEFELDTSRAETSFGVFNAAMGHVRIRDYIGAPAPREVDPESYPLPDDGGRRLKRLFEYLFGDERGRGRVISDSRQLRNLGRVLSDESGESERVLRRTRDLATAIDAAASHDEGAQSQMQKAIRALLSARSHVDNGAVSLSSIHSLVDECQASLNAVREAIERAGR